MYSYGPSFCVCYMLYSHQTCNELNISQIKFSIKWWMCEHSLISHIFNYDGLNTLGLFI